tara:strand:+ start:131 stop:475 length:345 start_codon:yes stop_codon:yes gene_type:complete
MKKIAKNSQNDSIIESSISKERKYLIPYSELSTNEQKKVRGKIRRKLFSFSDKLFLIQKNPKNSKDAISELKKEFSQFATITYCNLDFSNRNLFYNGSNENKIAEIENLLKIMK